MFTGLIEATGRIEGFDHGEAGGVLRVSTPLGAELREGDSIAVSGVCLTATSHDPRGFTADVSRQTLSVTSLGRLHVGRLVNLERPLRADGRLGGHFVLGHVDAVGRLVDLRPDGDGYWLDVEPPAALAPYFVSRGSVALDGVSLTIAALTRDRLGIQIVPFTFGHTALAEARVGDPINIEADVLGKYVARLVAERPVAEVEG
jgi:riboflavin synthase